MVWKKKPKNPIKKHFALFPKTITQGGVVYGVWLQLYYSYQLLDTAKQTYSVYFIDYRSAQESFYSDAY